MAFAASGLGLHYMERDDVMKALRNHTVHAWCRLLRGTDALPAGRRLFFRGGIALALLCMVLYAPLAAQTPSYKLPFSFIENHGQWDASARYMLDCAPGLRAWFSQGAVLYDLAGAAGGHVLRQRFIGAEPIAPLSAGPVPGAWNFIGADATWAGVAGAGELLYPGIYPGIDVRYYQQEGGLKYDLIVAPGADPYLIRFTYDGALGIRIAERGELRVGSSVGDLIENAPYCYQEIDGIRREVPCRFIQDRRGIGFHLGEYDRSRPLVIDPALIYSSYLGGAGPDDGRGITLDPAGNIYVTGFTRSKNFPTTPGAYRRAIDPVNPEFPSEDIFVVKLDPTGSILLYATYINASGNDRPAGIVVKSNGVAVIAGVTFSTDFPTTVGAYQRDNAVVAGGSGFVLGLNPNGGSLAFSTFLGGSKEDQIEAIALTTNDTIVVGGWTRSPDFPTTPGAFSRTYHTDTDEGFISRLDPFGAILRNSTYIGGNADDRVRSIGMERGGTIWATGWTSSADFPADTAFGAGPRGLRDCFISGFRPDLSATVSSMTIGGAGDDEGEGLAVRGGSGAGISADTVYVVGSSTSLNFPIEPLSLGGASGSWIAIKVIWSAATLRPTLVYSRYLGRANGGSGHTVQADREGNAFLCGTFRSARGDNDLLLVRLDHAGRSVLPDTEIGGTADETPWRQSFLSIYGDLYITGTTRSVNLPTITGAFDRQLNNAGEAGQSDAFLLRYGFFRRPAIYARPVHDFGTIRCPAERLDTFNVYNLGDDTLRIWRYNFVRNESSPFQVVSPNQQAAPFFIAPGDSLRYIVRFTPGNAGEETDRLQIFSNDSAAGRYPLELHYSIINQVIATNPSAISFGAVPFCSGGGTRDTMLLTVGVTPAARARVRLRFSNPRTGESAFSTDSPAEFDVNGSSAIRVIFEPKKEGTFTDTLVITTPDCNKEIRVPLQGSGRTISFTIVESELRFPPITACPAEAGFVDSSITVMNTSDLPITVYALDIAEPGLSVVTELPVVIPPGASRPIVLRFSAGKTSDTVIGLPIIRVRECNASRSIAVFAEVRNHRNLPDLPPLDFGAVIGCPDSSAVVDSAVVVYAAEDTGVRIDLVAVEDPTGSFTLFDRPSLPWTIEAAGSVRLPVRYAPTDTGRIGAQLLVVYRSGLCVDTLRVALRGTYLIERAEAVEPIIDLPPLSECAGGADTVVTLRNTSNTPVRIVAVMRSSGIDPARSRSVPFTIPPGGTITDTVQFSPRHAGAAEETLTYITSACRQSITVTLRGSRRGTVLTFARDTFRFDPLLLCQTGAVLDSAILGNAGDQGTVATVVSAEIIGSGAFALARDIRGATIVAGEGLSIPVRFLPSGPGRYRAVLRVRLDPCDTTIDLALVADVLRPVFEVHGGEFGEVVVGARGTAGVTVVNRNPVPVRLERLAGVVAPFALVDDGRLPMLLAAGDSVELNLEFTPTFAGTFAPTASAEVEFPCVFSANVPLSGLARVAAESVEFCVDGFYSGGGGDTVEIALRADRGRELPGRAVYYLRYDWRRLRLLGVVGGDGISTPIVVPGEGRASFTQSAGSRTGTLLLRFQLLAAQGAQTSVGLDSVAIDSDMLVASSCGDSAHVLISDRCLFTDVYLGKFRNMLEDVRPNPSGAWVEITYQQLEDARAVVRVFDAVGREVLRPLDAMMQGGRYTIRFSVADLPTGAYFYSVEAGSYREARQMLVER